MLIGHQRVTIAFLTVFVVRLVQRRKFRRADIGEDAHGRAFLAAAEMQCRLRCVFDLVVQHVQTRKRVGDPSFQKVRIEENEIPLDVFALEECVDGVRQYTMKAVEGRIDNHETVLDGRQELVVEESSWREDVTVKHVVDEHLSGREERIETRIVIEKEGTQGLVSA